MHKPTVPLLFEKTRPSRCLFKLQKKSGISLETRQEKVDQHVDNDAPVCLGSKKERKKIIH